MMKKETTIITPELSIVGNVMAWKNSAINLSNISSISTVALEFMPFPVWTLLFLLVGIVLLSFRSAWAVLSFLITFMGIANWLVEISDAQRQRKLIILTNAGVTFSFVIRDLDFLDKVYAVLISAMAENHRAGQNIKINIKNSQISGNAQILDDLIF